MAQGAVAMAPAASNGAFLSAEELREILEYDKIIQLRDAIVAGTHPRIKVPAHLIAKVKANRVVSTPSVSAPRANIPSQVTTSTPTTRRDESSSFFNKSPNNHRSAGGAPLAMSSKSEINPILLEKSDDLIKAEIQLQRNRLERGLREQIEKQRIEAKALLQTSESLPNFDLSEVLSKALEIVHPSTVAVAEDAPSVGARSSGSDSFDENTFYSSQHDSPAPSVSPQASTGPVVAQSNSSKSIGDVSTEVQSAQIQVGDQDVVMAGTSLSRDNRTAHGLPPKPHSHITAANPQNLRVQTSNSDSSSPREVAASASMLPSGRVRPLGQDPVYQLPLSYKKLTLPFLQISNNDPLRQAFSQAVVSPVMRAHNLSPLAPQPSRVSPLATARDPPILRDSTAVEEVQAPQVTALRTQISGISSTDSSPKASKGSEKKKKEKKKSKRKAKDSLDAPDSPYIKPEPRSPSPYGVAPLPRPQKRQRQVGRYAAELNYDEPTARIEPEAGRAIAQAPVRREYERVEERYEPEIRRPEPAYRRIERDDDAYRRVGPLESVYRPAESIQYARGPQSPAVYALPYQPGEVRPRAVSYAIPDRRVYEEPRHYREPAVRASVRPDTDRERSRSPIMRPPPQPLRLVVDEYGNRFYEPIPAASMRQSVAPPARYREAEPEHERVSVRTVSSRVPAEVYEDGGVVYRRPSPLMAAPRRVVTQPEYALPPQPEYREYRQREYSVRPSTLAPPPSAEPHLQVRGGPERREMSHFEEAPREYIRRAASVRPDAVRYEVPREYAGRMQSVRPVETTSREYVPSAHPIEVPSREYAASVRPEARREMAPPQREYSVRPEAMPRREAMVGPEGERYYEEPMRRPAEIAFIERPRAREASVLVYADDVRREVYR